MGNVYLEKDNSMAYFINCFAEEWFVVIDSKTPQISASAFVYSDVEQILFKNCTPNISEKMFESCGSLATVIFGKLETDETFEQSVLKNLTLAPASGDFVIQANAFNGCGNLRTLVLPKVDNTHKLVIERDAFCACGSLRTVVALCKKIDFTDNPFPELGEYLTFICKKNSGIARFAREYGYRSVYVD